MFLELNYNRHLFILYKKDMDAQSNLKLKDKLATKLIKLMTICQQNFQHTQKL